MFGLEPDSVLRFLILFVGFYMAWNIGANDVSNAMGTSVGSGALTLRRAVVLAAILEFSGAFFVGSRVSETMQHGIVDPSLFLSEPNVLVLGMTAALLGTSLWLQVASYFGLPVSTTHAIVGAILGFGVLIGGPGTIHWHEVGSIALSWVISPLCSGLIAYGTFTLLQKHILYALTPVQATRKLLPLFFFIVFATFTLSLIFGGLENVNLSIGIAGALGFALLIGLLAALLSYFVVKKTKVPEEYLRPASLHAPHSVHSLEKAIKHLQRVRITSTDATQERVTSLLRNIRALAHEMRAETSLAKRTSEYDTVEKMFVSLQVVSACYVAFAHGANDVSNAIGPVAAVLDILQHGSMQNSSQIPSWLLAFGGLGIVIGLATFGWRVIETIGKKITALTPTRGFAAEFGAATTILAASKLGLPVSTTHCLVGAVLGVGLARGLSALNLGTLRDIVISWIITIPTSAAMSIGCYFALKAIFIS